MREWKRDIEIMKQLPIRERERDHQTSNYQGDRKRVRDHQTTPYGANYTCVKIAFLPHALAKPFQLYN
jgi:hypothetical protein